MVIFFPSFKKAFQQFLNDKTDGKYDYEALLEDLKQNFLESKYKTYELASDLTRSGKKEAFSYSVSESKLDGEPLYEFHYFGKYDN
ncbi:hypothetical protein [Culicoidibacter larvae]|uniref:Uncharacterized protein n=1 Tax=Culicoidibacter larvae TaxID=2579976 RepID=A0A5R8QG94_9FIRM|nr:hypothetical protein [Culicoidibacter larvae]TLG76794.1 hypothetical protein FEZ08_04030 [Culicoidibacter larvae]